MHVFREIQKKPSHRVLHGFPSLPDIAHVMAIVLLRDTIRLLVVSLSDVYRAVVASDTCKEFKANM